MLQVKYTKLIIEQFFFEIILYRVFFARWLISQLRGLLIAIQLWGLFPNNKDSSLLAACLTPPWPHSTAYLKLRSNPTAEAPRQIALSTLEPLQKPPSIRICMVVHTSGQLVLLYSSDVSRPAKRYITEDLHQALILFKTHNGFCDSCRLVAPLEWLGVKAVISYVSLPKSIYTLSRLICWLISDMEAGRTFYQLLHRRYRHDLGRYKDGD